MSHHADKERLSIYFSRARFVKIFCVFSFIVTVLVSCTQVNSTVTTRDIPTRYVDGVRVTGFYSDEDVKSMLSAVMAEAAEPIEWVSPPWPILFDYYNYEPIKLENFPKNRAWIRTNSGTDEGIIFKLNKTGDIWVVFEQKPWAE